MSYSVVDIPGLYISTGYRKRAGEKIRRTNQEIIWICQGCSFVSTQYGLDNTVLDSKSALMLHLAEHERCGLAIPQEVFTRLAGEIAQEEKEMVVINAAEPDWQLFTRQPFTVIAFQWDSSMEDIIPEISRCGGTGIFEIRIEDWETINDGDWVLRDQLGNLRRMDDREFNRKYKKGA